MYIRGSHQKNNRRRFGVKFRVSLTQDFWIFQIFGGFGLFQNTDFKTKFDYLQLMYEIYTLISNVIRIIGIILHGLGEILQIFRNFSENKIRVVLSAQRLVKIRPNPPGGDICVRRSSFRCQR